MPFALPPRAALLLAALTLIALPLQAAEDCSLLSRIPDCPPAPTGCGLAGDCPPQDCSTCTPAVDDDGDCVLDEEILNGVDDDGDGMIDEDISCLNSCDPLNYACPSVLFDGDELTVPHPVRSAVTLPARVRAYGCAGTESFRELSVTLEPDPDQPEPFCSGFRMVVTLSEPGNGAVHFQGPAILVNSRRWESLDRDLLSPPALGNVRMYRYALRADLAPAGDFTALPPQLAPACMADGVGFPHLFFYGHLDLAVDAEDASHQQVAVALHHAPSSLSHPPTYGGGFCETDTITGRPIDPAGPGSHDGGWMVVAPSDDFTFAGAVPVPVGQFRHGRVRYIPSGNQPCEKETGICVSQFEQPAPPAPAGSCASNAVYRHVRYCANEPTASCQRFALSSDERCDTIPNDLIAFFPVGRWAGSSFPGGLELSFFEGALSCVPPDATPWRPYWYGSYLEQAPGGLWRSPERTLDLVDNQHADPMGRGLWRIGAVNWFNEGTATEQFVPLQFRTMTFFPDQNPDIPTLAPCEATAVIAREPADCAAPSLPVASCVPGEELRLTGECSTAVNCCQCGGLEYQWSRRGAADWELLAGWSTEPVLVEAVGPADTTDYRLEVRCSTSKVACVDEIVISVEVLPPPTADPTATPELPCNGEPVTIDAGACARCTCDWSASLGPNPTEACVQEVAPTAETTYQVIVTDPATGCSSPMAEVTVSPRSATADAGPDLEACSCDGLELAGDGDAPDCASGLEYRWRRLAPVPEWVCGSDADWLPESPGLPRFACTPVDCAGTFELQVRCADAPNCIGSDEASVTIAPVAADLIGGAACDSASITLDASGSTAACPDPEYRFLDPLGGLARDWSPDAFFDAEQAGSWTVELRCPGDASCNDDAQAEVILERSPELGPAEAVDPEPCAAGLLLSWPAATFHGGSGGVYNLYRSQIGCAEALAAGPLVLGLSDLSFTDLVPTLGAPYYYVVEAEDAVRATACLPGGPVNGGAVTRVCLGPVTDAALPPTPAPACRALRMSHVGHEVTARWDAVRSLLPGEHFHLLKVIDDPTEPFLQVNPEDDVGFAHVELDGSSALQFFDLRIANACEQVSADEFPPGLDVVPHPDCP